jgi:hypothetical protein
MREVTGDPRKLVLRPLVTGAPLLFFILVALLCAFSLLFASCQPVAQWPIVYLSPAILCLVLWSNHVAILKSPGESRTSRLLKGALADSVLCGVVVFFVSTPILLLTPTDQCSSSRMNVNRMLDVAQPIRATIEQRIGVRKSLDGVGEGLAVKTGGHVQRGTVTREGTIVIEGNDPAAVVILEPQLDAEGIRWKCTGFPESVVPTYCRSTQP